MNNFITSTGYHTLEDIAIEVGARKLGLPLFYSKICKCFLRGSPIPSNWKPAKAEKLELIAAAFPFEVLLKDDNGQAIAFHKYVAGIWYSNNIEFPDSLLKSDKWWQLFDPLLKMDIKKPCGCNQGLGPCEECLKLPEKSANCEDDSHIANCDTQSEPECSCGAIKCGLPYHSDWCDSKKV